MVQNIIDIHPHILSDNDDKYPRSPLFGVQSTWSKERPVTIDMFVEQMKLAGVAKAAIVQASTCYGHDNSYVTDSCLRFPDICQAVCSADFLVPDAVDRIKHWQSRGMIGLRLFMGGSTAAVDTSWLDDPRSFPSWDYAAQNRIPVCLQMSDVGFERMENIIRQFPNIILLLDHLALAELTDGYPYEKAAPLFRMAKHKNIYLKCTPRTFGDLKKGKADAASFFKKLVGEYGASRLAWGSNYPNSPGTLKDILTTAREGTASLSETDKEWIFGKTALTLYPTLAGK